MSNPDFISALIGVGTFAVLAGGLCIAWAINRMAAEKDAAQTARTAGRLSMIGGHDKPGRN